MLVERCHQRKKSYCVTRRELLGIIYGLRQFRHYLLSQRFELRTDHAALTYLLRTPEPVGQQARYLDLLAEYNFKITHRSGSQHGNVDALSRRPCNRDPTKPPCSQCKEYDATTIKAPATIIATARGTLNRTLHRRWKTA
jgi:hypothetical protein